MKSFKFERLQSDRSKEDAACLLGLFRVPRDMAECEPRVELYGPLRRLETICRNRELGERKAQPCTPEDDVATMLRRSIHPGMPKRA